MSTGAHVQTDVRRKAVWGGELGRPARLVLALIVVALTASCGEMSRQGTASSYLIVTVFEGASGAEPNEFGGTLLSDVLTVVDDVPTFFNDIGRVTFRLALKDPGSSESQLNPTANNFITINRYHVKFRRADGHNIQGTDVPYEFDGAFTADGGRRRSLVRLHARAERGKARSAPGKPGAQPRHHLDDCGSDVLRPRSDGPRGQRGGEHRDRLRELRRSQLVRGQHPRTARITPIAVSELRTTDNEQRTTNYGQDGLHGCSRTRRSRQVPKGGSDTYEHVNPEVDRRRDCGRPDGGLHDGGPGRAAALRSVRVRHVGGRFRGSGHPAARWIVARRDHHQGPKLERAAPQRPLAPGRDSRERHTHRLRIAVASKS